MYLRIYFNWFAYEYMSTNKKVSSMGAQFKVSLYDGSIISKEKFYKREQEKS